MSEVTRILSAIEKGDPQAAAQLLPLVYEELRSLAAQKLAQEKSNQTLQATALVHEAYLRLVGAKDDQNYYVAKLMIARPGPLPMVDLVHYPVTAGKDGPKIRVALPFSVRNDTLYQVEMNIRGDQFRATVNGHVVDSWNDNSLRAGGVGFVSGQGEAARVRWIRVSERDDVIGRVCSYLSARATQSLDDPVLSASYYMIFRHPGQ